MSSDEHDKSGEGKDRKEVRERSAAESAATKLGERSAAVKQGERHLAESAATKLGEHEEKEGPA